MISISHWGMFQTAEAPTVFQCQTREDWMRWAASVINRTPEFRGVTSKFESSYGELNRPDSISCLA